MQEIRKDLHLSELRLGERELLLDSLSHVLPFLVVAAKGTKTRQFVLPPSFPSSPFDPKTHILLSLFVSHSSNNSNRWFTKPVSICSTKQTEDASELALASSSHRKKRRRTHSTSIPNSVNRSLRSTRHSQMVIHLHSFSMELVGLRRTNERSDASVQTQFSSPFSTPTSARSALSLFEPRLTSFCVTVFTKGFMAIPVDQRVKPEGISRRVGGAEGFLGSLMETETESSLTLLTRASDGGVSGVGMVGRERGKVGEGGEGFGQQTNASNEQRKRNGTHSSLHRYPPS